MIKFKVFDVGDIHYEEQLEQFQKEHQNAEFVQITGGYTSYEKIWFKYDDRIERPELNENQQIVLDWLKNDMLDNSDFYNTLYSSRRLYVVGEPYRKENIAFMKLGDKELAQVIQAFSRWAIEQEET
ncbi:hypothetical protein EB57_00288 [Enterococcus faecalis]|uniref:hypothetical protein n=1 Tax=Enterococcus faecalis TaxID=1351 RepID=UPI000CF35600|nr:hypothetical protein [Enterococcus faecalis]NSV57003.1 hypothetical protein [Enterococcus faecalis]NSV74078.1 hypothetical protein [Enterococcus faecalis]PQH03130.1 hypothetical protein CUS09_04610 [Enterococcus faecalis]RBR89780.1 hypothetical protein EB57_00288 [Enterococcus faecalis]TQA66726.1 hypothetical protein FKZ12_10520 [Enterococcus faecalis]